MSIKLMTLAWELDLQASSKLVLLALCDWSNDEGLCYPSMRRIARRACLSDRQSKRVMHALAAANLIEVVGNVNGGRASRRYQINVEALRRSEADTRGDNLTPVPLASPQGRHQRHPSGDIGDTAPVTPTSPEPTIDPSPEPTTEPGPAKDLVWPRQFDDRDVEVVGSLIACLDKSLQQPILDEIQGAFDEGKPPARLSSWTRAVVARAKQGTFVPDRALRVARDRARRAKEDAEAASRKKLQARESRPSSDPQEIERRRARIAWAKEQLRM